MGLSPGPDPKVRENTGALLALEQLVVSGATVISAVFSVLAYVRG